MTDQVANLSIEIKAQTDEAKMKLKELQNLSKAFGAQITGAFTGAIFHGRNLGDTLRGLASNLSEVMTRAALAPVSKAAGSLLANVFQGVTGLAKGGALSQGMVTPFASGGVVASPTLFPLRGGAGLMGEAGAEAILPLARGADGRLGVRSDSAGAGPVIHMTVSTPNAESFRRSEVQIAAALNRALARGRRNL